MDRHVDKQNSRSTACRKINANSPSIMQSLDSMTGLENRSPEESDNCMRLEFENGKVTQTEKLVGLNLMSKEETPTSFQIIDSKEKLLVSSADQFLSLLGIIDPNVKVKVVSIFGSTGDGKSYALNQTFFDKKEVFKTSSSQSSCTLGIWIAYDPNFKLICIDTEGLLSSYNCELQTTRLLLKVLAVSDVVLYRTRTERLPRDMFIFLGSASKAYTNHFQSILKNINAESVSSTLGPTVVIFHESRHTKPLQPSVRGSPEDILKNRFAELKLEIGAFSSLMYIGQQASTQVDFSELKLIIKNELDSTTVRSPRHPALIFETLRVLNAKFSEQVDDGKPFLYADQYFNCSDCCLSCGKRCELSVGHLNENIPHKSSLACRYQQQYGNYVYVCKICHGNGIEQTVVPLTIPSSKSSWYGLARYVWSGYTIKCPTCGEIYSSRQYWYGNKAPEDSLNVISKVVHMWPGMNPMSEYQNMAQKVVDGVSYISEAVASVCIQPTKILSSYVADQIAPKYWRPNDQIKHCHNCKKWFQPMATKHHCRNCGEGFCEGCSSHYMPVPNHGWNEPVRVCTNCYNLNKNTESVSSTVDSTTNDKDIRARKYGEVVISTLSTVATVFEYPKEFIKGTARPSYWVPDEEITNCCVCKAQFGANLSLHHCRDCGRGVCSKCSANKKTVPKRNWETLVRVCDECFVTD